MCFSAEASFIAGSGLLLAGVATLKKVSTPSQLVFASVPLIFSVQQFSEGFLWISLTDSAYAEWHKPLTHVFLFFAQVVWPAWIPFAFLLIEKDAKRKKLLKVLSAMGLLLSTYMFLCLFNFNVTSKVTSYHIFYEVDYPDIYNVGNIIYLFSTVISTLISRIKWVWIMGILDLISFIISFIFFMIMLFRSGALSQP